MVKFVPVGSDCSTYDTSVYRVTGPSTKFRNCVTEHDIFILTHDEIHVVSFTRHFASNFYT